MITIQDIEEAIKEYEGTPNPSKNTCLYLAAFYTLRDHLYVNDKSSGHSYQSEPILKETVEKTIDYYGDSEFLLEINGRESYDVWEIIDELMTTLQAINLRLYTAVIQKIKEI